jgi:hypothetical protein
MRQLLAGMSPRLGVRHMPRLRAETHFGVQARALSVGLHIPSNAVNKLLIFYGKVNRNLKLTVFGLVGFQNIRQASHRGEGLYEN